MSYHFCQELRSTIQTSCHTLFDTFLQKYISVKNTERYYKDLLPTIQFTQKGSWTPSAQEPYQAKFFSYSNSAIVNFSCRLFSHTVC